jgi:hypothetical protein
MQIFARNPFRWNYLATINIAKLLHPFNFDHTPRGGLGGYKTGCLGHCTSALSASLTITFLTLYAIDRGEGVPQLNIRNPQGLNREPA